MKLKTGVRKVLQGVEYAALKAANYDSATGPRAGVDDLLKSKRMADLCESAINVLDVGCGNGGRLMEMSLFLEPEIDTVGVDVAVRRSTAFPGAKLPTVVAFDGTSLPFDDNSFDVVMTCYVLHHLSKDHSEALLAEMVRVSKQRILVLEDSVVSWKLFYKIRNWAHLVEANMGYASESENFTNYFSIDNFRTHAEWKACFESFPEVKQVVRHDLLGIKRYKHHTLFRLEIEK